MPQQDPRVCLCGHAPDSHMPQRRVLLTCVAGGCDCAAYRPAGAALAAGTLEWRTCPHCNGGHYMVRFAPLDTPCSKCAKPTQLAMFSTPKNEDR